VRRPDDLRQFLHESTRSRTVWLIVRSRLSTSSA
jgi:hypothetical protein